MKSALIRKHASRWDASTLRKVADRTRPAFATEDVPEHGSPEAAQWWADRGRPMPQGMDESDYDVWAHKSLGRKNFSETVKMYETGFNTTDAFHEGMTNEEFIQARNEFADPATGWTSAATIDPQALSNILDAQGNLVDRIPTSYKPVASDLKDFFGLPLMQDYDWNIPSQVNEFRREMKNRYGISMPTSVNPGSWDYGQWKNFLDNNARALKKNQAERAESAWGEDEVRRQGRHNTRVGELLVWGIDLDDYGQKRNAEALRDENATRATRGEAPIAPENFEGPYPDNTLDWTDGHLRDAMHDLGEGQVGTFSPVQVMESQKRRRAINHTRLHKDTPDLGVRLAAEVTPMNMSPEQMNNVLGAIGSKGYNAWRVMALTTSVDEKAGRSGEEVDTILQSLEDYGRAVASGDDEGVFKAIGDLKRVEDHGYNSESMVGGMRGPRVKTQKYHPSTSEKADKLLASYLQSTDKPLLMQVGKVMSVDKFNPDNPKHMEIISDGLRVPAMKSTIVQSLKEASARLEIGGNKTARMKVDKLVASLEEKNPDPEVEEKKLAEVEEELVKEGSGGSISGAIGGIGNVLGQVWDGLKSLFSIDGLKAAWEKFSATGDWTALIPLLVGGAGLFFLLQGILGGSALSGIGGALALAGGAWLAGGGLDTIKGLAKPAVDPPEEVARDVAEARADQAAKAMQKSKDSGTRALDPDNPKIRGTLLDRMETYGVSETIPDDATDAGGWAKLSGVNPREMFTDILLDAARGKYLDKDGKPNPGMMINVDGKNVPTMTKEQWQYLLAEAKDITTKDQAEYQEALHGVIREYAGSGADKIIADMQRFST